MQAYTGGAEVKSRVDIFVREMGIVTSVGCANYPVARPQQGHR
jgi:3-hydroxyisobutyrate dehydrogenase